MYLVMNQADIIFEQKRHETAKLDDEHSREEVTVYVYPTGDADGDNLTVTAQNRCEFPVKIVRVWINNTYLNQEAKKIDPFENLEIGSYDVDPKDGSSFYVEVTTERGNVFQCSSGPISYDGSSWNVENLMINVVVSSPGIVFKIHVYHWTGTVWDEIEEDPVNSPAQVWKIGGSAFKSFVVTNKFGAGDYKVEVKRGSKTIHEEEVSIEWPDGPSTVWIYA